MTNTLPWPIQEIAGWLPWEQAAGFFLATFILEDVAVIGAGCLLVAGVISWPVAFLSCFLGIWSGDAGLYALARFGGRAWFERSRFKRFAVKVTFSEKWFADSGTIILIFSRCIPGARLPTYLAAGFLRLQLSLFLAVTGLASFVWTLFILWLAQTVGLPLVHAFHWYRFDGLILLGVIILAVIGLQCFRRAMEKTNWQQFASGLMRWRHWEFWPAWFFYPPVFVHGLWLMIKYRGFTVPTAANPGMFSGGMVGESKGAILRDLALAEATFTASAGVIERGSLAERLFWLNEQRLRLGLDFPFILKPEQGQRGAGVKIIRSFEQAGNYLRQMEAPLIIQRYIAGPGEVGVFYYRFPHEKTGQIFSVTEKIFPVVTGDGKSTLTELVHQDARAKLIAPTYLKRFSHRQHEVLAAGKTLRLVEAGNHAQGCIFRDGGRLITPELTARIDDISQKLDGFFIGRYDIRFDSEDDLKAGRNFQIIELNGAAAEATSIYDSRNSLWLAYRTLFKQWDLVFAIGAANRARGFQPMPLLELLKTWRDYACLAKTYPIAD